MKRITKIILSLMVVLCIALYTMGVNAQGLQPDLSKPMLLTVSVGEEIQKELGAVSQEDGTLCYDLYRIADIEDGFTYKVTKEFSGSSEISDELSKASIATNGGRTPDWQALAQQAFEIAVGGEGSVVNAPSDEEYTGLPLGKEKNVEKGLYLLVARGTKQGSSVVKSVSAVAADGENNYEDAQYAVCVTIGANVYTISPQIVCVPTKIVTSSSETSETITTADSTLADGTWIYDLPIGLKMSVEPALGAIEINKTLTGHTGDEKVVCVFQVDAYYPTDNDLYSSEVYSVMFDRDGRKPLVIDGLPIGAKVIVTEVYSGANYIATVPTGSLTVSGSQLVSVTFENTRDNERSGGGVTNHFTYQVEGGEGKWDWTQADDNTQTANGVNDTNR